MWTKFLVLTILSLSIIGSTDAAYLSWEHYNKNVPTCRPIQLPIPIAVDCGQVLESNYAEFLGIPIAVMGLLFYLTIFFSAVFVMSVGWYNNRITKLWFLLLGLSGLMVSVFLVYVQLFILKSICLYCMLSAVTSTLIAICTLMLYKSRQPLPKPDSS